MSEESDFNTRKKAWAEMTKVLYDEVPVVTFGERAVAVVCRANIRDVFGTTTKYYWNTWIAK